MVKLWESKNAQRALKGSGLTLMAMSLTACGSDSVDTPAAVAVVDSDLTVSPDTISASGDVTAARAYTPGGNDLVNTLQSDDVITGLAGTAQAMTITFGNNNDAGAATVAPTITNIEIINFNSVSSDGNVDTLDLGNATGVTNVNVTSLDDSLVIRGIDTVAVNVAANSVSDETTGVGFEFDDSAVSGAADSVDLAVNGFNGADINVGAAASETADGTGVETLNLSASGSASTIANIGSTGNTTVNVDADAELTVTAMSATGIETLNLTGSTAATSINVAANISANEFAYTGGAGSDTLIANSGFTGTDTLNAGTGSADVLSIRAAAGSADVTVGALNADLAAVATGWDTLDMRSVDNAGANATDFTVDMDHLPGVSAVSMRAGDTGTKTVFTLNDLSVAQAGALSVTHTGTNGGTDSEVIVDMKVNGTDTVKLAATVTADTQVVELNDANDNIENAEITLAGAATTNLDVDVSSFLTSLKVSGGAADESLVITNAHTSATLDMSEVVSDVTATLGAGTQTASFGSGDDEVTSAAGIKTVTLGAGDDTFTTTVAQLGTAATSWDSVNAGEGTDTLALSTMTAVTAEAGVNLTGFERLSITGDVGAAATHNMAAYGSTFARITVGDTDDDLLTLSNVALSFSDLRISAAAESDTEVALERVIDTATNSLAVTIERGETVKVLTINDEETGSFGQSGTAGNVIITTLNNGDMTSMTVTGAGDFTVTNAMSSTVLATVDASIATGRVDMSAANSTVAITATGNALDGGVFDFTGGSGDDVITGGLAADILIGGAGTDTIVGGAGADDITGGDGADTLTGGTGLDTFHYVATTVSTHGADTIADFTASQGDEISIDIATAGGAAGTADGLVLVDANGEAAAAITNADLVVIEDGIVIDVSGNATADLAAINAVLTDGGDDEAAANAEFIVILNADTNGDGNADAIQAWYMHETGGANSQADEAALIATLSNLSGTADLTDVFGVTNVEFV
ncbi:calcium-binding protein [uncultured Lentibacter sp.]|uniref:beta strand repeat-containing protein n=1 Tax=uncultured Lentibacter sp. TaxID=1659309 RepID=UPI00262EBF51|nr:calcium-binding protein [uncultured Lentibacter sp.]